MPINNLNPVNQWWLNYSPEELYARLPQNAVIHPGMPVQPTYPIPPQYVTNGLPPPVLSSWPTTISPEVEAEANRIAAQVAQEPAMQAMQAQADAMLRLLQQNTAAMGKVPTPMPQPGVGEIPLPRADYANRETINPAWNAQLEASREALELEAAEEARRRQAAEIMRTTPDMFRGEATNVAGYNPMPLAWSLYKRPGAAAADADSPEAQENNAETYLRLALEAKQAANEGRRDFGHPGTWFGPMVGRLDAEGNPIEIPRPPELVPHPSLKLTDQQMENIKARKEQRATAQQLISARARGQSPSGYRADIGTATPADLALLGGAAVGELHPDVIEQKGELAKMLAEIAAQAEVDKAVAQAKGVALGAGAPPTDVKRALGGELLPGAGLDQNTAPYHTVSNQLELAPELRPQLNAAIANGNAEEAARIMQLAGVPEDQARAVLQAITGRSDVSYEYPRGVPVWRQYPLVGELATTLLSGGILPGFLSKYVPLPNRPVLRDTTSGSKSPSSTKPSSPTT